MLSKTFKVPNINCSHCTNTIERELKDLEGIITVKANKDSKMVIVEWDEKKTEWNKILELLEEINFIPEDLID